MLLRAEAPMRNSMEQVFISVLWGQALGMTLGTWERNWMQVLYTSRTRGKPQRENGRLSWFECERPPRHV